LLTYFWCGKMFAKSLPRIESLLWVHYIGFQTSCHFILEYKWKLQSKRCPNETGRFLGSRKMWSFFLSFFLFNLFYMNNHLVYNCEPPHFLKIKSVRCRPSNCTNSSSKDGGGENGNHVLMTCPSYHLVKMEQRSGPQRGFAVKVYYQNCCIPGWQVGRASGPLGVE
jgi:hypothetical protein